MTVVEKQFFIACAFILIFNFCIYFPEYMLLVEICGFYGINENPYLLEFFN